MPNLSNVMLHTLFRRDQNGMICLHYHPLAKVSSHLLESTWDRSHWSFTQKSIVAPLIYIHLFEIKINCGLSHIAGIHEK